LRPFNRLQTGAAWSPAGDPRPLVVRANAPGRGPHPGSGTHATGRKTGATTPITGAGSKLTRAGRGRPRAEEGTRSDLAALRGPRRRARGRAYLFTGVRPTSPQRLRRAPLRRIPGRPCHSPAFLHPRRGHSVKHVRTGAL